MAQVLCIGHAVQDFVFSVDAMPTRPDKYRARDFQTVGGGPAATAAVAIAKLGGQPTLAARLGDDAVSDLLLAELERYGVDWSLVRQLPGHTTSLSAVLVDKQGERQIVNYLDDTMDPRPDWLPQDLPGSFAAVLTDTRWPDGALHGLRLAREAQVPAVLDADLPVPPDSELVKTATDVAFSASGLEDYTGTDDAAAGLREAASRTDAWCCVTLGAAGTMQLIDGQPRTIGAFSVDVADTLGAGDVWHGAYALARAERQEREAAIRFANAAAALKVRNGGGREGTPTRDEVESFLDEMEVTA